MQTQLHHFEKTGPVTQLLIDGYQSELEDRRSQLLDDLETYRGKVRDLEQLDPLDYTGLGKLYRSHVAHIEQLLEEFDDSGSA